jgi:hypothetical protein
LYPTRRGSSKLPWDRAVAQFDLEPAWAVSDNTRRLTESRLGIGGRPSLPLGRGKRS